MKSVGKYRRTTVFYLLLFSSFLYNTGCGRLISSTTVSTENIPGTEVKTGIKKYSYEITKKPTVEDPTVKLKYSKAEQYKVQTKTKTQNVYEYKIGKKPALWMWVTGLAGSALGLIIDAGIMGGEGLYGSEIGFGVGLFYPLFFMKPKTRYDFTYNQQLNYLPSVPITSAPINIINSDKSLKVITDLSGYLKFSPVQDFNLVSSAKDYPFSFKMDLDSEKDILIPLELKPSLWMYQYARISSSDCKINLLSSLNYSKELGIARKGMEYKILSFDDKLYKYNIELFNKKTGWINAACTETFYSVPKKYDMTTAIKNYVEDKINSWQQQGEFESLEMYRNRILQRDEKLNEITIEAMNVFQQDYIGQIDWKESRISRYDPNSQTFKISIPNLQEIILKVSIDNAQSFKENWIKVIFKNQKFVLVDGIWELSSLELENPETNYSIKYDSKISNLYDPTNQFAFDLEPITVVIPFGDQTKNTKIDIDENYSINTNLPLTNVSNPDAVAVVIGNSNYIYTDAVNYAINDAQLMKVYLTNVLGYKSGNIIFIKNATKGDFEGTFGTGENYKGRLFDYIKPEVSDVFVYYSGHGAPGINDRKAYFVPVDCDPLRVELQGYPLDLFYKNLEQIPAKSTTVVLDACFSGAGVLKNISSIGIPPKNVIQQISNSLITTSSDADEVSSWYAAKQHGLFTYFFLKAIHDFKNSDKNNDGNLTYQEIYNYVSDNSEGVPYYARRLNKVEQHPTMQGTNKDAICVSFK
jgi:hypothetical protein